MIARLYDASGNVLAEIEALPPEFTFGPFDAVTTASAIGYEIEGFGEIHRESFDRPYSAPALGTITVHQPMHLDDLKGED